MGKQRKSCFINSPGMFELPSVQLNLQLYLQWSCGMYVVLETQSFSVEKGVSCIVLIASLPGLIGNCPDEEHVACQNMLSSPGH